MRTGICESASVRGKGPLRLEYLLSDAPQVMDGLSTGALAELATVIAGILKRRRVSSANATAKQAR